MKVKKMLVICHDASLSGAPVLLLNLLELLKNDSKIKFRIVIKRGGPMAGAFKKLGPTLVLKSRDYMKNKSILGKIIDFAGARSRLLFAIRWNLICDFLFSNTITNGRLIRQVNLFRKPVITYVHELANVASQLDIHGDTKSTLALSNLFFCPSKAVSDFLENKSIPTSKRKYLPYFFPFRDINSTEFQTRNQLREDFALKYNLNLQTTWIVAMGTISKRKGYDLFLETFDFLNQKYPGKFSFVWIGTPDNEATAFDLTKRLESMEVKPVFTGSLPHSYSTLAPFDIFFSSSREDPYPLVVLEAAFQRIPAVCFRDSGGIQEFVADDAGWVIPGFSPEMAAEKFATIQREELKQKGEKAFEKVMELHSDKDSILNKFYSGMNEVLQNR